MYFSDCISIPYISFSENGKRAPYWQIQFLVPTWKLSKLEEVSVAPLNALMSDAAYHGDGAGCKEKPPCPVPLKYTKMSNVIYIVGF